MSVQAIAWVLDEAPGLTARLMPTLLALANEANRDGANAWPSVARIARQARKSERQVRYDLRELERIGLIARGDQRLVSHLDSRYRPVVWDLVVAARSGVQPIAPLNGRPSDSGVQYSVIQGCNPLHPTQVLTQALKDPRGEEANL